MVLEVEGGGKSSKLDWVLDWVGEKDIYLHIIKIVFGWVHLPMYQLPVTSYFTTETVSNFVPTNLFTMNNKGNFTS